MRNFIHAADIAEAFDVIVHKGVPGQVYNIGTDFEISITELAKYLLKKVRMPAQIAVCHRSCPFAEFRRVRRKVHKETDDAHAQSGCRTVIL